MGENESSRANSLALLVFTPFALQKAGGRRRIAFAVLANVPAGPRGARPKSFLTIWYSVFFESFSLIVLSLLVVSIAPIPNRTVYEQN